MYQLNIVCINALSPHHNLAYESYLYEQLQPDQIVVLLWRNSDAVIIGRAQNPWMEVNLNYIADNDIPLIRRNSGGGTVYHDQGNINFSFMAHKPLYKNTIASHIVNTALNTLGLNTSVNTRNDILLRADNQDYKISGSAYRETPRKGLHHGTILVSANIPKLRQALHPHNTSLISSCIKSVRVPVMNLNTVQPSLTNAQIMASLITHFTEHFKEISTIAVQHIQQLPETAWTDQEADKFYSWDWNFGKTPKFTQPLHIDLSGQTAEGMLEVNQGIMTSMTLEGEAVSAETLAIIQQALVHQSYRKSVIWARLNQLDDVLSPVMAWPQLKACLIDLID